MKIGYCFACNKQIDTFTSRCQLKDGWVCMQCFTTKFSVKRPYSGDELLEIRELTQTEFAEKYKI